jgi:hypothetical protein
MSVRIEHVRWGKTLVPRLTIGRVGVGGFWMGHGLYLIWGDPNHLQ